MRGPRRASILLLLVLFSPSNAKAQGPDDFTIGGFIGDQIAVAAEGLGQCRGAINALNGQIARARTAFWEAYPNGPGLTEARAEFQQQLATKDYMMLMLLLMMEGQRNYEGATADDVTLMDFIVRMCGGLPDGGVAPGAGLALRSWIEAVQAHAPNVMGFTLADREVLADPAVVEAYRAYTRVRDRMELYRGPESPFRTASTPIQKARAWVGMHYLDAPEGEADVFHRMLRQALGVAAADRALMEFSHVTPAWMPDAVNDSLHEIVSTTNDPVAYRSASILLNDIDGRELRLSELNARLVQRYSEQELEHFARSMMELHAGRCRTAHCFRRIVEPGTTPEQYVAGYRAFLEEQRRCNARPFEPGRMTPPTVVEGGSFAALFAMYPQHSRDAILSGIGEGGRVVVMLLVPPQEGYPPRVFAVDTSSGNEMVDQMATNVAHTTTFLPATVDGEAIAVCYRFAVEVRPVDEDEIARMEVAPLTFAYQRDAVRRRSPAGRSEATMDAEALTNLKNEWRAEYDGDCTAASTSGLQPRRSMRPAHHAACALVPLAGFKMELSEPPDGADPSPSDWYSAMQSLSFLDERCEAPDAAATECLLRDEVSALFEEVEFRSGFLASVDAAMRRAMQPPPARDRQADGNVNQTLNAMVYLLEHDGARPEDKRTAAHYLDGLLDALTRHCEAGRANVCYRLGNEASFRDLIAPFL